VARLHRYRWTIALFVAALVVRLHWNLVVHPPGDYIYSDMRGYVLRADQILDDPWTPIEYHAFFPYGTHLLIAAMKWVFGRENYEAIAVLWALMGAATVAMAHRAALRMSSVRWVPAVTGVILVAYYPLISLSGYFLSETGFAFGLAGTTLFLLRMCDRGRWSDALLAGAFAAFGMTFRPQLLVSGAAFVAWWLVLGRRFLPKVTFTRIVALGVPLVLVLGVSAARLHHHTGRWGLVSENGSFNKVMGRCHNKLIIATPDAPGRVRTSFSPPPLIQLMNRGRDAAGTWPQLEPVMGVDFEYEGYVGDAVKHQEFIDECERRSGWRKQLEFKVVNALLLWRWNVMWPDSGKAPFRAGAEWWTERVERWLMRPSLLSLLLPLGFLLWPARLLRPAIVSLHLCAMVLVGALYFGDPRSRSTYDPFAIMLALEWIGLASLAMLAQLARVPALAGVAAWAFGATDALAAAASRPDGPPSTSAPAGDPR